MYPVSPFSFAVQAAPSGDLGEWTGLARRAEDLGYRALLLPDHVGSGGGAVSGMATAAAATEKLTVGSLMAGVDFRNPVVLAQELMTLDRFTRGRLEIGLGAGWLRRDYVRAGMEMDSPEVRIEKLREWVEILQGVWSGAAFTYKGVHYSLEGSQVNIAPHSDAPKLTLGGGGERMVRFAAGAAGIVNLSASMAAGKKEAPLGRTATHARFAQRTDWVTEEAERRDFWPELQCLAFTTAVTGDRHDYVAKNLSTMFSLDTEDVLESPLVVLGTIDEICRSIEARREALGISYWVIKSSMMEDFAPVAERLTGH